MNNQMESIFNLSPLELTAWLSERGHPAFHTNQILQWIYQRKAKSFEEMTNLSKNLREQLKNTFHIELPLVVDHQYDEMDGTTKILLRLPDQEGIEAVKMPRYTGSVHTDPKSGRVKQKKDGLKDIDYTLCLSTQAGCLFSCRFCASGSLGLKRNLTTGEILSQILYFKHQDVPFSHIVFMGTGEPLHNFNHLRKSIEIICDKQALGFSPRRLTVSTIGLVPQIYRMAKEDWKVKLAVSLHATTDEKRKQLVPIANAYQLDQLMDALRFYQNRNKRRITFEYLMIEGMNDKQKDVERLTKLCEGLLCHVNLIPYNSIPKVDYQPTSPHHINRFKKWLLEKKFDVTVRYSRGRHIDAACGQLRLRHSA